MATRTVAERESNELNAATLPLALPAQDLSLTQDTEWCVVKMDGEWREIRFHDYDKFYRIPGLYERVIYELLQCQSPQVISALMHEELEASGQNPKDLRILDLGAGNGIVGAELKKMGVGACIGVDIIPEAAESADRDNPGVYEDYLVADLTDMNADQKRALENAKLNGMVCVAALGFGDIPPAAFAAAYNFVADDGLISFNIKEDFLKKKDRSGFSKLVELMREDDLLQIKRRKLYRHRINTQREPLEYFAFVGRKQGDIPAKMLDAI